MIFRRFRESIVILTLVFLAAIFMRFVFFGSYRIQTNSMSPYFIPGDYIFGFKSSYGLKIPFTNSIWFERDPQLNDIVVVRVDQIPDFKAPRRVIGLPGDRAVWKDEELYINDKKVGKLPLFFKNSNQDEFLNFDKKKEIKDQDNSTDTAVELEKMQIRKGSFEIKPGFFFVAPENKKMEGFSAFWGLVPKKNIESKIHFVWFSYGPMLDARNKRTDEYYVRWSRIFKIAN